MCEYIGIRLTGYEKKLITEILKITVRLTGYGFTALPRKPASSGNLKLNGSFPSANVIAYANASVVTSPVLQLSHTLTRFCLQLMFVAHTQCASSQFNTCLNSFSGLKVSVLERMTGRKPPMDGNRSLINAWPKSIMESLRRPEKMQVMSDLSSQMPAISTTALL